MEAEQLEWKCYDCGAPLANRPSDEEVEEAYENPQESDMMCESCASMYE